MDAKVFLLVVEIPKRTAKTPIERKDTGSSSNAANEENVVAEEKKTSDETERFKCGEVDDPKGYPGSFQLCMCGGGGQGCDMSTKCLSVSTHHAGCRRDP